MAKRSAGILMYRQKPSLEVFLVHPGGPFWAKKDLGAWSIPKGEYEDGEDPQEAARREFQEETGFSVGKALLELGTLKQTGGKNVSAWAFEGDCNPDDLHSNTCMIEWPPRSKRMMEIAEADRGGWFSLEEANLKILKSQLPFLDRFIAAIAEVVLLRRHKKIAIWSFRHSRRAETGEVLAINKRSTPQEVEVPEGVSDSFVTPSTGGGPILTKALQDKRLAIELCEVTIADIQE
ncbi:NUDIX domain-containing protein [Edaphobacter albus]|uniref:NUDIX domain-containing protein n=1 Tax=Edaphobacter sp. 4G125 TaxID=2763071 RepID=UPI001647BC39|nr:NUDIX domain-containing protein [Edaphobacter sp. 4G125]QNI36051.1 NUDIX domain-containing protein [Edaphobacter sp. 4G125]